MKKVKDEKLFVLIKNFLLVYLPVHRNASPLTVTTYRTTLNQFLSFAAEKKGMPIISLSFNIFSYEMVSAYLENLVSGQERKPATYNNRLSAIRAFVAYASACYPEYISQTAELAKLKTQRDDTLGNVEYMSENAIHALMNEPSQESRLGLRDMCLMVFMYDSGARIQEVLHIRLCDLSLKESAKVTLYGKGKKIRIVPISAEAVKLLEAYLDKYHHGTTETSTDLLFYAMHAGEKRPLSDDAVRLRLQKYADSARVKCPEVPEHVHPHMWRHSRAMHLYQHGMPLELVSQWLGHSRPETTLIYAYADTEHKREAIERALGRNTASTEQTPTVSDEELLKQLYGLRA